MPEKTLCLPSVFEGIGLLSFLNQLFPVNDPAILIRRQVDSRIIGEELGVAGTSLLSEDAALDGMGPELDFMISCSRASTFQSNPLLHRQG